MIKKNLHLILLLSIASIAYADSTTVASTVPWANARPMWDNVALYYDGHFDTPTKNDSLSADAPSYGALYLFSGVPTPEVAGCKTYLALEGMIMQRQLYVDGMPQNNELMQRYGFFGGSRCAVVGSHEFYLFALGGVASDFKDLGRDALYINPIVDWHWVISPTLTVGLGARFIYNFDTWVSPFGLPFAPLVTVAWQADRTTTVQAIWDNIRITRAINERFSLTAMVRYTMRNYRLDGDKTYEFETIRTEVGPEFRFADDIYLRLHYFQNITTRESILSQRNIIAESTVNRGNGVSMSINWAK